MNSQNPSISSMLSTFPRRSVGALDYKHPDYDKRDTDKELLDALKKGDFCFVLNSPQTGKSSLMVQILNDLKEEGFLCISIDLTGFVEKINYTSDQFYRDFSQQLLDNLKENIILSNFKLDDWWLTKTVSPLYRLRSFITDIILQETSPQKLVIFVDEINCTLNFESRSDFFKLIRFFYNRRPMTADYNRLTFALLGIATPSQLCPNERISPFSVGKNIKLRPFQPHEITRWKERLVKEINYSEAKAKEAMERILSFTNGHPYLTHSLYNLVIKESANANTDVNTDQLVEEKIIRGWRNSDCEDHFQIIIQSLSQPNKRSMDLLSLYEKIVRSTLNDCPITAVQANSSDMLQIDLKLLGLVLEEDHVLKPYCKIYEQIFNLSWIEVQQREVIFYKEDYDNYCNTDKYQKQRYLLTGKILKRTLKWASENENTVKHLEKNFFEESEKFWKKAQKFFPDQTEDECETIIQGINSITGGSEEFNNIIFDIAKENIADLQQNEVHGRLEDLVFSHLNLFEEYDQFQKDRDQFLNQDDSFELISLFEKITQNEPILFDEKNPQHRKLKDMCFIILDKEHNLRILNEIYEKILDQNWIKGVMAGLRPYTKAFRDWQHSDRQESSYLLQNNDLKLALEWLGKKPTPKLEEGEIEFVMTSLVAEVWANASPSVQSEAVSLITTFRPSLQGKNNYSDFLLREILQWTTSQTSALEKLLGWVNESEIPVENNRQWIESLVRSHLKTCNAQQLSEYIDFKHPYNHRWQELKKHDENFFLTLDRFISQKNINLDEETLKRLKETLDINPPIGENLNRYETVTNFHELVCSFLYEKLSKVNTMIGQKEFDKLLDGIVTDAGGDLESILIFDLTEGLALYGNRELKTSNPSLYFALFGDGDEGGEAIKGFNYLLNIESALSNFGGKTGRGDLSYSIFKLKEGSMMVYFVKIDIPIAICFIAAEGINIGNLRRHGAINISKIQGAIS